MARPQNTMMLAGHPTRHHHEEPRPHDMPMRARRRLNNEFELQCGHVDGDGDPAGDVCHGPSGVVQLGALTVIVDASGSPDAAPPREHRQLFLFAPEGFVPDDDGVWQQSEHAERKARHGGRPTYRRPVRSSAHGATYALEPAEFPYTVRCPWCGEKHTLRDCEEARRVVDK
jgi:hypothetical protein